MGVTAKCRVAYFCFNYILVTKHRIFKVLVSTPHNYGWYTRIQKIRCSVAKIRSDKNILLFIFGVTLYVSPVLTVVICFVCHPNNCNLSSFCAFLDTWTKLSCRSLRFLSCLMYWLIQFISIPCNFVTFL